MKRKNHWVLFAILLLALINLSPGEQPVLVNPEDGGDAQPVAPPSRETAEEAGGHIRVAVQMPDADFARLEQMNQEFMDEHPIQVDLVNVPPEHIYASSQRRLLQLGESPDVLLLDNVWIRRYAADGYLLPTESYYPGSLPAEVLNASLGQNEWNGYVWGVPLDMDPYVFLYDSGKLKQLGIDQFPASPDDWDTLIKALKNQTDIQRLLAINYNDPYAEISLMWQLGGGLKPPGEASPFTDTVFMQEFINRMEQMRPFLIHLKQNADVWNKFSNGEIAVALIPASEAGKRQDEHVATVYPAAKPDRLPVWVGGRSYAISSQTENAEAAGLWISAMTSQAYQRGWYQMTGHLPVLKKVFTDASQNELPAWVLSSRLNGAVDGLPVGAKLPEQLERFSRITKNYLDGDISSNQYRADLEQIAK